VPGRRVKTGVTSHDGEEATVDARLSIYGNETAAKFVKYINAAGGVFTGSALPAATQELVKIRASQINGSFNLAKVTNDVLSASGADGNHEIAMDVMHLVLALVESLADGVVGDGIQAPGTVRAEPEPSELVGLIAGSMDLLADIALEANGTGTLGEIKARAADLGEQIADRYIAARDNLG
jgi:hypothetical protein